MVEIELEVEVWWGDEEKAKKLKDHIMTCSYPGEYEDESQKILQEIRGPEVNDGAYRLLRKLSEFTIN